MVTDERTVFPSAFLYDHYLGVHTQSKENARSDQSQSGCHNPIGANSKRVLEVRDNTWRWLKIDIGRADNSIGLSHDGYRALRMSI